jgi:hypothetical protein
MLTRATALTDSWVVAHWGASRVSSDMGYGISVIGFTDKPRLILPTRDLSSVMEQVIDTYSVLLVDYCPPPVIAWDYKTISLTQSAAQAVDLIHPDSSTTVGTRIGKIQMQRGQPLSARFMTTQSHCGERFNVATRLSASTILGSRG